MTDNNERHADPAALTIPQASERLMRRLLANGAPGGDIATMQTSEFEEITKTKVFPAAQYVSVLVVNDPAGRRTCACLGTGASRLEAINDGATNVGPTPGEFKSLGEHLLAFMRENGIEVEAALAILVENLRANRGWHHAFNGLVGAAETIAEDARQEADNAETH